MCNFPFVGDLYDSFSYNTVVMSLISLSISIQTRLLIKLKNENFSLGSVWHGEQNNYSRN